MLTVARSILAVSFLAGAVAASAGCASTGRRVEIPKRPTPTEAAIEDLKALESENLRARENGDYPRWIELLTYLDDLERWGDQVECLRDPSQEFCE